MTIDDTRGQISVELVMILGVMVVLIMIVAGVSTPLSEEDAILSSAKEGATEAIYNITVTNPSFPATRITETNMVGDSEKTITLTINPTLPEKYKQQVIDGAMESVTNQPIFTKTGSNTISGRNYNYKIVIGSKSGSNSGNII